MNASVLTSPNFVTFDQTIEDAFPTIDPGITPFGVNVIVQIRFTPDKTKGGLWIDPESRKTEQYNTQTAKVVAMGPLAFKTIFNETDDSGEPRQVIKDWPEGAWFKINDFVRVPKYGGDRFSVTFKKGESKTECLFAIFKAKDILGLVTGNPLAIKAFLD